MLFSIKNYSGEIKWNITKQRYRDIVKSDHYWKVMEHITSDEFDNSGCWSMCFQHKVNQFLWDLKQGNIDLKDIKVSDDVPEHINFV